MEGLLRRYRSPKRRTQATTRMWERPITWCSGCSASNTHGARWQKQRQKTDKHGQKNSAGNGPVTDRERFHQQCNEGCGGRSSRRDRWKQKALDRRTQCTRSLGHSTHPAEVEPRQHDQVGSTHKLRETCERKFEAQQVSPRCHMFIWRP